MSSPAPKSPEMSDKSRKYDRQIRLWGEHGQTVLENAQICLINATALGTEILKGIVLPGIGGFTIVDHRPVTEEDVGCNFFLDLDSVGQPRAKRCMQLLQELNPDVNGDYVDEHVEQLIDGQPDFFRSFDVVVATSISERTIVRLSNVLWEQNIPLIVARSVGFYGVARLQLREHCVIETHPDNKQTDLRLEHPFEELKKHMAEAQVTNKVPWLVVLYKVLQEWVDAHDGRYPASYREKLELRELIRSKMDGEQENFEEAIKAVNSSFGGGKPSSVVQEILQDDRCVNVNTESNAFWIMARALKDFVDNEGNGLLPVPGVLPDMTADTNSYISLQTVYRNQAAHDAEIVFRRARQLLKELNKPNDLITDKDVRLFCREAANIAVVRGTKITDEFDKGYHRSSHIASVLETPNSLMGHYIVLRALDRFQADYGCLPGESEAESDTTGMKSIAAKMLSEWGIGTPLSDDLAYEICRYGGAEIHSISAYLGGCIAHELIKLMSYASFDNNATGNSTITNEADFQKTAQIVVASIQKILQNVSSMQRMVNQFGTAQDSPELKQQLHQIRSYTQQLINDTTNQLNDLVNCKERHLKIQRDRLVDEFSTALNAFQAVQRKTVDLEKNAVRQARQASGAAMTLNKPPGSHHSSMGSNYNNTSNSGGSSMFEDNFITGSRGQTQEQMQEEIDLQALEDQERTIRELEENIVSVNEIYKKLGALVYEQSHQVDSIEASVEQTSVFVSEGVQQLKQASHYQNKARKKKLILAVDQAECQNTQLIRASIHNEKARKQKTHVLFNMKFTLSTVTKCSGRLGMLGGLDRLPNLSLQTPAFIFHTKGGSIPHLSKEAMQHFSNEPACFLHLSISNTLHMQEAIKASRTSIAEFIAQSNCATLLFVRDPSESPIPGLPEKELLPIYTRNGRRNISLEQYMTLVETFRPDAYVPLYDGDTDANSSKKREQKSLDRTEKFVEQCLEWHRKSDALQSSCLIGPVVGGYNEKLREQSIEFLRRSDDTFAGYLIEGLHMHGPSVVRMDATAAVPIVGNVCKLLPEEKVRFCFGPYDPIVLLDMISAGVDVFDTSYAFLKAAQEHRALVFSFDVSTTGEQHTTELDTTDSQWAEDFGPLLPGCMCYTCQKHSRAYVHHLYNTREMLGPILLMMHNLHHYTEYFKAIRHHVANDSLPELKKHLAAQKSLPPYEPSKEDKLPIPAAQKADTVEPLEELVEKQNKKQRA
uniref:Queuine tRNA-ribosyltransferase accessory subunit 2 n=1 Tax=Anopheles epiroticus TaxID=199890 RepID=A0A182PP46_9DIPT